MTWSRKLTWQVKIDGCKWMVRCEGYTTVSWKAISCVYHIMQIYTWMLPHCDVKPLPTIRAAIHTCMYWYVFLSANHTHPVYWAHDSRQIWTITPGQIVVSGGRSSRDGLDVERNIARITKCALDSNQRSPFHIKPSIMLASPHTGLERSPCSLPLLFLI